MRTWEKCKEVFITDCGDIVTDLKHHIRQVSARRTTNKFGYYLAFDFKNPITKKWETHYVHRMVCETFKPIENAQELEVNHIDSDKLNHHPSNLEWTSKSENRKHAYRVGANPISKKIGENNGRSKLTWASVGIIRDALKEGYSTVRIAAYFNVSQTLISRIKLNHNWNTAQ